MVTTAQIRAAEKLKRQLEAIERREERVVAAAHFRARTQTLEALEGVDAEVLRILNVQVPEPEFHTPIAEIIK